MMRAGIGRGLVAVVAFLLAFPCQGTQAVDAAAAGGPRPAVVILSGSKGFGSSAYAGIETALDRVGLDVVELHVLTTADMDIVAKAGGARNRIAYYATRMPRWIEVVRAAVDQLNSDPRHTGRVGLLGISLGAHIAAAAAADREDIRALALVDGGTPDGYGRSPRRLPPLSLVWGGADRVFPVATARKLLAAAQSLQGQATLRVYEGGHDFFLQAASPEARSAWRDVAAFFASRLN